MFYLQGISRLIRSHEDFCGWNARSCLRFFQKEKANGIAKKVRRTEEKRVESIPIPVPVEQGSHTLRASRENPASVRLMIALPKSEFDSVQFS